MKTIKVKIKDQEFELDEEQAKALVVVLAMHGIFVPNTVTVHIQQSSPPVYNYPPGNQISTIGNWPYRGNG